MTASWGEPTYATVCPPRSRDNGPSNGLVYGANLVLGTHGRKNELVHISSANHLESNGKTVTHVSDTINGESPPVPEETSVC